MSLSSHDRRCPSFSDDWESLCYVLYSMLCELPWSKCLDETQVIKIKQEFKETKSWKQAMPEFLCNFMELALASDNLEVDTTTLITSLMSVNGYSFT